MSVEPAPSAGERIGLPAARSVSQKEKEIVRDYVALRSEALIVGHPVQLPAFTTII
jgi:hypothetical protein